MDSVVTHRTVSFSLSPSPFLPSFLDSPRALARLLALDVGEFEVTEVAHETMVALYFDEGSAPVRSPSPNYLEGLGEELPARRVGPVRRVKATAKGQKPYAGSRR
jgi:hypothetical protein